MHQVSSSNTNKCIEEVFSKVWIFLLYFSNYNILQFASWSGSLHFSLRQFYDFILYDWMAPSFSILRWFRVYRLRWLHQWPVAVSPLLLVSDENTGDGCCVPTLHCCLTPCQHLLILMVVFILQIMPLHLKEVEYPLKKMCFSCNILHESVYIFSDGK